MSIPKFEDVKEYMKGQDECVIKKFYEKYSAEGWMIGGRQIFDWKILADKYFSALLVNKKFREL